MIYILEGIYESDTSPFSFVSTQVNITGTLTLSVLNITTSYTSSSPYFTIDDYYLDLNSLSVALSCSLTFISITGSGKALLRAVLITADDGVEFDTNIFTKSSDGFLSFTEYTSIQNISLTSSPLFTICDADHFTFTECSFENITRTDSDGHGCVIEVTSTSTTPLLLTSVSFTSCSTPEGSGGAIYSEASVFLQECNFTSCEAKKGGAIYTTSNITFLSSQFTSCNSSSAGGGISVDHSGDNLIVLGSDSTFESCVTRNSGGGINVRVSNTTVELNEVMFLDCNATLYATVPLGGGMCYAEQIYAHPSLLLISCTSFL